VGRDDTRPLGESSLGVALLAFGIASAGFDVGCVLIKTPFLRSGITAGDAIEVIGVYAVLALFARAGRLAGADRGIAAIAAALAGITFALGHGIHVAANSIHDLVEQSGAGDPTGLLDFWDEHVGHYLVDSARVLFAVSLCRTADVLSRGAISPNPASPRSGAQRLPALLGGIAYGFATFASAVEGQTVPLMLPFYLVLMFWAVRAGRRSETGEGRAVRLFFLAAAATALLFFALWGIWQHGFPEFTRAGILRPAS
jgi:hypothetical protein